MKGTYQGRASKYKLVNSNQRKKTLTGGHWTDSFAPDLNSPSNENLAGDTRN